ncbi:putative Zinc knuckle-containing protein 19, partial [Homarus americanus]
MRGPAAGLLNGTRTFKVNLKNNIPSSVTVGGHSVTFLYAGQRKTCYKCGHEGHLAVDCHTEEVDKVNIFNEEDFPAKQLSGEIHSSRAGVKEGVESVTVSLVPATTRHGVETEEVPVQTISQDAVDPEGTTHPDCSENAAQETSTTCEAKIHTERNNVDQSKGKISCENMEYDKADDTEATNMTRTECEVARGENKDRMEEIDCTKQNKNNENQSNLSGQVNSQTGNGFECGKGRKDDGKKMDPIAKDDSRWEKVEHVQSWKVRAVSGSQVMLSKRDGKEIAKKEENKGDNSTDEEEKRGVKRNK